MALTNDSFNDIQSDAQLQDGISNNIVTLTKDLRRNKVSRRGIPFPIEITCSSFHCVSPLVNRLCSSESCEEFEKSSPYVTGLSANPGCGLIRSRDVHFTPVKGR